MGSGWVFEFVHLGKNGGRPEVCSVLSHPPRSGGAVTGLGGGVMFGSDDEEVVLVGVGFVKFANHSFIVVVTVGIFKLLAV